MSKMCLTTLLLLVLMPCIAAQLADDHQVDTGSYNGDRAITRLDGERYTGKLEHDGFYILTQQRKGHRQKRGLISFLCAWRALLKTTLGSRVFVEHALKEKIFVKVGTLDNAVEDFYSLNPTRIIQDSHGLRGHVGNQIILLDTHPPTMFVLDGNRARDFFGVPRSNKISRGIAYFENPEDARKYLREEF